MTIVIIITATIIIVVVMITGRLVIEFILESAFFKKTWIGAQDVGGLTGIDPFHFCCSTQLLLPHHPLQHFLLEITFKRRALALFDLLDRPLATGQSNTFPCMPPGKRLLFQAMTITRIKPGFFGYVTEHGTQRWTL
ncbi:MAG: hypothetical protein CMN17_11865 [Roseovarius sp.]|nr:hypothetical protein [Roseovarius sp.]MBK44178.1 hypothetical protein [Roseovarius sp.]